MPSERLQNIGLRVVAGYVALLGLFGLSLAIAIPAAVDRSFLIPSARHLPFLPDWLAGPFAGLGASTIDFPQLGTRLTAMFVCYVVLLWAARDLPRGPVTGAIFALYGVALLAPPLLSADIFGYIEFARMGILHGVDPYTHVAGSVVHDPVRELVRWDGVASPYGPLFTLGSYALVPAGIKVGMWLFKILAVASAAGIVAVVWRLARQAGRTPVPGALLIAANPLVLVFGLAGGHNDAIVMLALTVAIGWALNARARHAGIALAIAAGLKASSLVAAPYMLIGVRERGRFLLAAVAAAAAVVIVGAIAFGTGALGFFTAIGQQQDIVALHAVPNEIGRLLGFGGITQGIRVAGFVIFAIVVIVTLRRAWQGSDWVVCAGWATLTLLLTSAWLLPWYVLWVLPLAAIGNDRRLTIATVVFTGYLVATRTTFLLA